MSNYWLERTKGRLDYAEVVGKGAMEDILPIYEQALRNINKEINKLYSKYATEAGLDVRELTEILSGAERSRFLVDIRNKMLKLGFDLGDVYDPRYIGRITRLEAIKQQIYWEIQQIAPQEEAISESAYKKIIEESYKSSRTDIRKHLGKDYRAFAQIDDTVAYHILRENWKGGNYSTRIWANNARLNIKIQDVLPKVIGGGLVSGISQEKMARQIRDYFDVGRYNAMRLVRTETNYFTNQAELQSYVDEGIEYYRYEAILDERTSDICRRTNGKVFKVTEAEVGVNYPPLHPNCRSDTTLVFSGEAKEEKVWNKTEWLQETKEQEEPEPTNVEEAYREVLEAQKTGYEAEHREPFETTS
jgi:SPP1 gp7 family putative phage head morphogenesis protein